MKQQLLTGVLVAGCVVCGIVGFVISTGQDKKAPVIKVEKTSISYTENESYDVLLEGVTAKDDVDGDLTDQIFIDKIVPMENGKAMVYYGAVDSSNNVGTAKRKVDYTPADGEAVTDPENADGESTDKKNDGKKDEKADGEKTGAEKSDEDKKAEENKDDGNTEEPDAELKPNGRRPAMALKTKSKTIKAGEGFDLMSVIKGVVDDVDKADTLYRHVCADGHYDTDTPGTYTITYYVIDSEGNSSEPIKFTLKVQ